MADDPFVELIARQGARDDGKIWGYLDNGRFVAVPKRPLIEAGLGPPPFDVTLPDGRVRHIIHDPTSWR